MANLASAHNSKLVVSAWRKFVQWFSRFAGEAPFLQVRRLVGLIDPGVK
jgi:hypothetical protein